VYLAQTTDTRFGITCSSPEREAATARTEAEFLDAAHRGAVDAIGGRLVRSSATATTKSATVKLASGAAVKLRTFVLSTKATISMMVGPVETLAPEAAEAFLGSLEPRR
jgi:hypothetical protein